MKNPK